MINYICVKVFLSANVVHYCDIPEFNLKELNCWTFYVECIDMFCPEDHVIM